MKLASRTSLYHDFSEYDDFIYPLHSDDAALSTNIPSFDKNRGKEFKFLTAGIHKEKRLELLSITVYATSLVGIQGM